MNRRLFGKEQIGAVQWQIAVHFIGRYLMIALNPVFAASVHQHAGSQNIGLQKDPRIHHRAVHMAFRRKVDHHIRVFFLKQRVNRATIGDIPFYKGETGIFHHRFQGFQIARIGQLVQTDDLILRVLIQHIKNKVTANKAGTAGD